MQIEVDPDLSGLKTLINQEFVINNALRDMQKRIAATGRDRAEKRIRENRKKANDENVFLHEAIIPYKISSLEKLNTTIKSIEELRVKAMKHDKLEITFKIDPSSQ